MVLAEPGARGRAGDARCSARRSGPATSSRRCSGRVSSGAASRAASRTRRATRSTAAAEVDPHAGATCASCATFTVDPATARDFDDAVSAEPDGDGVRLWIHIADVSAHVRPGTALDAEAARADDQRLRARAWSSRCCRARSRTRPAASCPGVDRLAVTAEIRLDAAGAPALGRLLPQPHPLGRAARLRPARRDLRRPGGGAGGRWRSRSRWPGAAAAALAERRPVGALEIESFEPEFEFDPDGGVASAHGVAQTEAHRLIEHLMILANERVAELLEKRRAATLYRVHEQPDPERVERLLDQLAALDVPTPPAPEAPEPERGGRAGRRREPARSRPRRGGAATGATPTPRSSCARSSRRIYFERNLGSRRPRQPGLLPLHVADPPVPGPDRPPRAARRASDAGESEPDPGEVREAGWRCSELEREAMRIERRADRVCASFLLERELFENGWETRVRGRGLGPRRRRRVRPVRRRARRRLRGLRARRASSAASGST